MATRTDHRLAQSAITPRGFHALIASLSIACLQSASAQPWLELGPAPATGFGGSTGRVSAVACSPTDPNRYFIAGASGGVWRTTDGGTSWTPLTDDQPTTAIGALALDPLDENTIYAGMGEANFANHSNYGLGLLKSVDGGETWRVLAAEVFAGRCFSKIIVTSSAERAIYAAVTRAGGFPTLAAAKGHPLANGPVGVFKSTNGGEEWQPLGGGLPAMDATDLVVDPANPAVLYAAIGHIFGSQDNGIYKSADHGDSWTRLAGGLPAANVGRIGLAIAPSDPNRLYALIARPCDALGNNSTTLGHYRSSDGGATWTVVSTASVQATYGWYFTTVSVRPTNADTAFFGALGMSRTLNGGGAFTGVSPPHPDVHAMDWDASGRLVTGDDGGVHRSDDLGETWIHLNNGLGLMQCYAGLSTDPSDENIMYVGLQDNGTVKRESNSLLWRSIRGGDGGWTQVNQQDPLRLFAESQGTGQLAMSLNHGQSFTSVGGGITGRNCFLPPYLIDPNDPMRMLYATERFWLSTTGGTGWTPLSTDLTGGSNAAIRALAIAPSDSSFVYAATNDGRVLFSNDGGVNFVLRMTGNPGWPRVTRELVVDPSNAATVYLAGAVFGVEQVRRSRDAGATWVSLDGDRPDVPVNVLALDTRGVRVRIFAGTDAGVYESRDEGSRWVRFGGGMPNAPVVDLVMEESRSRLVAATLGRGVWCIGVEFCAADVDDGGGSGTPDGGVTVEDLLFYLLLFESGDGRANVDDGSGTGRRDGGVTIDDLLFYLARFAAGC